MATIEAIFNLCSQIFNALLSITSILIDFLGQTPRMIANGAFEAIQLPQFVIDVLNKVIDIGIIADTSMLSLMFGTGILFYLLYQFVIWLLNIVT